MKNRLSWRTLFENGGKPLIGMVHLPPLPGSPGFQGSMSAIVERVKGDVDNLVSAGFDSMLYVNEGDRPFSSYGSQESVAAMSAVVAATIQSEMPFGVEFLFDAEASLSIAAATGACFIRGTTAGVWESSSGIRFGCADKILRRRYALRLESVGIFSVLNAELAAPITEITGARRAELILKEKAADAILVGADPGVAVDFSAVRKLKKELQGLPLVANSGIKKSNIRKALEVFDGCLVGSSIKVGGGLESKIDLDKARELVEISRTVGDVKSSGC